MRVLISGGRGFLGRVLARHLTGQGHEVIALVRDRSGPGVPAGVTVVEADITDRRSVDAAVTPLHVDALCHLAALTNVRDSVADPIGYYDVNVNGTLNLLRAVTVDAPPPRVVFTSTSAVYGSAHAGPLREDLPARPENPYAATKLAAEQLVTSLGQAGAIAAGTLRCFNIAGAYSGIVDPNPTRIISAALRAAAGEIPHVTVNGDGSAVREFTHVLDVARAIGLALHAVVPGAPQVLNVGTGAGVSMVELLRTAEKVTGRPIEVVHRPPANEPAALVADVTRVRSVLGWAPADSALEDILRGTWETAFGGR